MCGRFTLRTPTNLLVQQFMLEGERLGLPVVGHIPKTISMRRALETGQRMIAHVAEVYFTFFSNQPNEALLAPAAEVSSMEVLGTPGTRYRIGWSESVPTDPSSWANTGSGSLLPAPTLIQLPVREGGVWLLWLTDLPETIEGAHQAEIREVRMHP